MLQIRNIYIIMLLFALPTYAQVDDSTALEQALENTTAKKSLLQQINISGNKVTRRSVILREMSVQEGDSIIDSELKDLMTLNQKRIFNLSIFIEVTVRAVRMSEGVINWEVHVKEQWYIIPEVTFQLADRNFNVWWVEQKRDIRRANIGVTLKNRNFRGNLENIGITAQIGYTQKFGIEYSRPYVDKAQKHGFGVRVFASRNEEWYYKTDSNKWLFARTPREYITSAFEASGSYSYRPAYATRHQLELRYRSQSVKDTIVALNSEYFLNGSSVQRLMELNYRLELNYVDNWNYPLTGLKTVSQAIFRVGIQGFSFQNQYQTELAYHKKVWGKLYSSHILRGRISYGQYQPYTYVQAMGVGSEYLRGFEYYVIDGSHYGLLRNNLKFELLNTVIRKIPIKYIATIPIRLYPKAYVDVGYAANKFPKSSYLNNRALYSGGFGLDIVSFYDFKLRLEYSWNDLGEKGLFLHINNSE